MSDLRNDLARARDEWMAGGEGMECSEGTASGVYLRNRLERAFIAGYNRAPIDHCVSEAMMDAAYATFLETWPHRSPDPITLGGQRDRERLRAAIEAALDTRRSK